MGEVAHLASYIAVSCQCEANSSKRNLLVEGCQLSVFENVAQVTGEILKSDSAQRFISVVLSGSILFAPTRTTAWRRGSKILELGPSDLRQFWKEWYHAYDSLEDVEIIIFSMK